MMKWNELDPEKLNQSRDKEIRGVRVSLLLSPSDVPEAVRGYFDAKLDRFVIEFRYIGEERWDREDRDPVRLRIGRHSKRLYGIEIDVAKLNVKSVALEIVSSVIDTVVKERDREKNKGNYRVAQRVMRAHPELFTNATMSQTTG